jgi:hypothetical protein
MIRDRVQNILENKKNIVTFTAVKYDKIVTGNTKYFKFHNFQEIFLPGFVHLQA